MHLLLKIGLHPTRSWNESWLPVLQSYPKSRSPCHLQTWGLNTSTALSLPTTLLLLPHRSHIRIFPLTPALSWAGLLFPYSFVSGVQTPTHRGSKWLPADRNSFHTEPTASVLARGWELLGGGIGMWKTPFSFLPWAPQQPMFRCTDSHFLVCISMCARIFITLW